MSNVSWCVLREHFTFLQLIELLGKDSSLQNPGLLVALLVEVLVRSHE